MASYLRDDGWVIQADQLIVPVTRQEHTGFTGFWWWREGVYEEVVYDVGDFVLWSSLYTWFERRDEFLAHHTRVSE